MVEVTAQHVKPTKMPLRYPCIICFSFEHYAFNCLKKKTLQNMFQTKPTTTSIVVEKTLNLIMYQLM
jgi:hypothetical protein